MFVDYYFDARIYCTLIYTVNSHNTEPLITSILFTSYSQNIFMDILYQNDKEW